MITSLATVAADSMLLHTMMQDIYSFVGLAMFAGQQRQRCFATMSTQTLITGRQKLWNQMTPKHKSNVPWSRQFVWSNEMADTEHRLTVAENEHTNLVRRVNNIESKLVAIELKLTSIEVDIQDIETRIDEGDTAMSRQEPLLRSIKRTIESIKMDMSKLIPKS